jgi:hypothetical protein
MKSIMQSTKECYICGATHWLHRHHCYYGVKNRSVSEKNGFTCWLCEAHHEGTYGVHGKEGAYLDNKIKRECQEIFELTHTREEFRKLIGKSYLEDDT